MFDITQSNDCVAQISLPVTNLAKRQAYGAYYTPLRVASLLADWAIRDRNDVVLEPCFGGCDFLEAMRMRFESCGQRALDRHIFGCDIDSDAFAYLSNRMLTTAKSGNFLQADFLASTPKSFGLDGFDAVVGNPPYIKNDRINSIQKESIKQLEKGLTKSIKGRVNLWVYFVVHAMSFLRTGGRMAFVLPGNFLTADYSFRIREELSSRFASVTAISVAERLFLSQGTEERTVVLLCDGYKQGSARSMCVGYCSNVEQLGNLLLTNVEEGSKAAFENVDDYSRLTKKQREVFSEMSVKINAGRVDQLGSVYIGIVLGDKKFFVRSPSDWKERGVSATFTQPIVSKFSYLSGLRLQLDDIQMWKEKDKPCYFLNTRDKRLGSVVLNYLSSNEKYKEGRNATFNRREIWHQPDDGRIADAFIGCISHLGPRLVLNSGKIQAANSIYRFNYAADVSDKERQLLVIALLTTFSQLSAELQGRPLGSGGLKLEPKDISQILVSFGTPKTTDEVSAALDVIDGLVRSNKHDDARLFADDFMFGNLISKDSQNVLREGLSRLRAHRHREKSIKK